MIKIPKQGEISIEGKNSYISVFANAYENNNSNGAENFKGEIKIQPHKVFDFVDVVNGEKDFAVFKSGIHEMRVKNKEEKGGIRISFRTKSNEEIKANSSFLILNMKLSALKNELLNAIKNTKVVSLSSEDFQLIKTGEFIMIKNKDKEIFLNQEEQEKLKQLIYNNIIIAEPRPIKTRLYCIDKDKNFTYRNVLIPFDVVRKVYLILGD